MAKNKFNYSKLNVKNQVNSTNIVGTDNSIMNIYLKECENYKKLDQTTEQYYISQVKAGSKNSEKYKNAIAKNHQAFVIGFAKKRCHGDYDNFMDLVQEGNYGMMVALENYNIESGVKFITYANAWILKYMLKFVEDNNLIQKPNRSKLANVDAKVREQFFKQYGYEPTNEELVEIFSEMGIGLKHKEDLNEINIVSLDQPMYEDSDDGSDDKMLFDISEDIDIVGQTDKEYLYTAIHDILDKLPNLERKVIEMRFGFNGGVEKDNKMIADDLGITVNEVKYLASKAIAYISKFQSYLA